MNESLLQSFVTYRTGPFVWNRFYSGLLEITGDNRLVLRTFNGKDTDTSEVIFDSPIADIKKVGGALQYLTVYLNSGKYRLELLGAAKLNQIASAFMTPGSRLYDELETYSKSPVKQWVTVLAAAQVKLTYLNGRGFALVSLGSAAAVLVLVSLLVLGIQSL